MCCMSWPGGMGTSPVAETILSAGASLPRMFTCKAESWPQGGYRADMSWGWAPVPLPAATTGIKILLGEVSEASARRPDTITVWITCNSGPRSSWAEVIYGE